MPTRRPRGEQGVPGRESGKDDETRQADLMRDFSGKLYKELKRSEEGFSKKLFEERFRSEFGDYFSSEFGEASDKVLKLHIAGELGHQEQHWLERFDSTTGLEKRGQYYEHFESVIEKKEEGGTLENQIEFYRHSGDEFTGVITSEDGHVYSFFGDMAYLSLFNSVGGHGAGDKALALAGTVLREAAQEIQVKIKKGVDLEKICLEFNKLVQEKCHQLDLAEKIGGEFKNVDLLINLGYSSIEEGEAVYDDLKKKDRLVERRGKNNKLAELTTGIADLRSDKAKTIDRIMKLSLHAKESVLRLEEIQRAIEDGTGDAVKLGAERDEIKQTKLEVFKTALAHSTKAVIGLSESEIIEYAREEDLGTMLNTIKGEVDIRLIRERKRVAEARSEEIKLLSEKADQFQIEELLRYKP